MNCVRDMVISSEFFNISSYTRLVCLDEDTSRHDLTVLYPTHIATYLQPLQHTRVPLPVNPRLFQQLSLDL